ncbi:hypothetical protein [Nitrosomonas sp.]|uniref:hypothetical protein n=1 Tax=Nitrosomonas sp. TaxID=42353 RepID=UPI0025DDD14E|nr:hypothetical protein [Nitrosomonas sp.]
MSTASGQIDSTLQIKKDSQVLHTITRNSTTGNHHRSITLTPDGRTVISGVAGVFLLPTTLPAAASCVILPVIPATSMRWRRHPTASCWFPAPPIRR